MKTHRARLTARHSRERNPPAAGSAIDAAPENASDVTVPRILFVDGVPGDAELAAAELRRDGLEFEPAFATTVEAAIAELDRGSWSAVITGDDVGDASGLDLLRRLRMHDPGIPVVFLSGTAGEERAADAMREGANDYVIKDRIARLATVVRRELAAADVRAARRRLEERLQHAEERYRRAFEQAPMGIGNTSCDGRYLSVNPRLCEIFGFSETEMIGRHFTDFIHPDDRRMAAERFGSLVSGAVPFVRRSVRRYVRKDGSVLWGTVTLSLVRNQTGGIDYVVGWLDDVSEQKEARDTVLLQSRLLDCVEQAVIATDLEGRVIFWNACAERLYGWSAEETIGRRIRDVLLSEMTRESTTAILERLRRRESWSSEISLPRRDGSHFPAHVTVSPIFDESDRVIGTVGVSRDLTAEKRAETELREHKLQLAEAQEIASIGSWTLDCATRERRWSDSLLRMYGVPPGTEVSFDEILECIHPDDREQLQTVHAQIIETRAACATTFRFRTHLGERTFTLRGRVDCDTSGAPLKVICVVQDVTDVKQTEEELLRRTLQQTAVANLGRVALSGADTQSLLAQAACAARSLLCADVAEVLRAGDDRFELAVADSAAGLSVEAGLTEAQAAFTIARNAPVVVEDAATETRFVPSARFVECGFVSGITVAIDYGNCAPWGVLGVHARSRRAFAESDVEFLQSIASILGQAIARDRSDAELRTRARQQSAIACLGRLVMKSVNAAVLEDVTDLLIRSLGADSGFFARLTETGTLREANGRRNLPNEIAVDAGVQAGFTILSGEPVVVDDYRTETRFRTDDAAVPHGILSSVMVPVASASRTFGVLAAQSRRARRFGPRDIDFVQALANILAEALEREQARLAIQASELRYRRIFDGASEMIFTLDAGGRCIALNPAFATLTGWNAADWLGRRYDALIVPEHRERIEAMFQEIIATGEARSGETTLLGRHGRTILEVQSFPKIENGMVTEIHGFARDVTEARRTTAERERITRSLELLLESTVEGIFTVDLAGDCTMVNRAAAAHLGMAREDLVGRPIDALLHRGDHECPISSVLRTGEAASVSSDFFTRENGSAMPVAYSAAPIVDDGRLVGAVVTFTDLTERRNLEAKLEQAHRLASLGRLAATVAHEFNNVLMGIAPFVSVIARGASPQKLATALEHISTSVQRGRGVTEEILRFTQPSEPAFAPVEVERLLDAIAIEARSLIGADYAIEVHSEPLIANADAGHLHQMFMNVMLNARDAMDSGGTIRIDARRERRDARFAFGVVNDPSRYVHFTVADDGCGMSEETLRHVFEPLFTTKRRGTGLGLAVTHQAVQQHGGEIFVESAVGAGTTFHIFIPLGRPEAPMPETRGCAPECLPKPHVLIVEDEPAVAAGVASLLECQGFAVSIAGTGEDAVARVRREAPDAVILDVGLPDMDGKEVFAAIAAIHPRLPVVFSTGHSDRRQLEPLVSRAHVGYLRKPYGDDALMEELSRAMAGSS